ncbi:low temperature-induced protein [Trichocoleus sp. Lan]|uniref:low temperature-induced protein n=1 Tax=Trichocoleus sp. Lan TaxID=2933927 RepID=UPI0032983949
MKSIRFNLSAWIRPVRMAIAACFCALVLFSYATPAYSSTKTPAGYSGTNSRPGDGEANLTKIEEKSQKAVLKDPYSLKETQKEAQQGLNEIQGSADAEKMSTNENSQGVQSVEQKVQKALEGITGKD